MHAFMNISNRWHPNSLTAAQKAGCKFFSACLPKTQQQLLYLTIICIKHMQTNKKTRQNAWQYPQLNVMLTVLSQMHHAVTFHAAST